MNTHKHTPAAEFPAPRYKSTRLTDPPKAASASITEEHKTTTTLDWLVAANARDEARRLLVRSPDEEQEMLLMRRPIPTQKAFAHFGMLLGALPPAAIFWRMFGGELFAPRFDPGWFLLLLAMNAVCCLVGRAMGSKLGKHIDDLERDSWSLMLLVAAGLGLIWAIVTGAAGGAVFVGIGAIFGVICAFPVGMSAFLVFTPLHRVLARGGMIDARHFWPLALGVVGIITALILRLSFS